MPIGDDQPTAVQGAFNLFKEDSSLVYTDLIKDLQEKALTPQNYERSVDASFKSVSYEANMEEAFSKSVTTSAVGATNATMITINPVDTRDYFMLTQFKGASLTDRIYSKEAQKVVKESLDEFFKTRSSVEGLFQTIKKNGFTADANLPKQLDTLIQTFQQNGTDDELLSALKNAKRYVGNIGTRTERTSVELRRAYETVLEAVEKGSQEALDKAVDRAVNKQVDSLNKRIARTETARAYDMSFQRAVLEDPRITAMKIVLSSGHPEADICDCYAEADLYGLGEGVVPLDAGVNIPFHPNCLCGKIPVIGVQGESKGQFSQKRLGDYLSNRDEKDRRKIVGAEYASNKSNYQTGLEKKGFQVTKKPAMIPKSLIESSTTKEE